MAVGFRYVHTGGGGASMILKSTTFRHQHHTGSKENPTKEYCYKNAFTKQLSGQTYWVWGMGPTGLTGWVEYYPQNYKPNPGGQTGQWTEDSTGTHRPSGRTVNWTDTYYACPWDNRIQGTVYLSLSIENGTTYMVAGLKDLLYGVTIVDRRWSYNGSAEQSAEKFVYRGPGTYTCRIVITDFTAGSQQSVTLTYTK
ncbi:MAG: hypothetical protein MJZ20_01465 [Bacteroidaceae bacterium]|nr:hypothetical protein [Bacteroidaceae bacterium]